MTPTPVTGVSAVSGPGIETRTATTRGRSQAANPARTSAEHTRPRHDRGSRFEGNTAQSYRPPGGATTDRRRRAGPESGGGQPRAGAAGGHGQRLRVGD